MYVGLHNHFFSFNRSLEYSFNVTEDIVVEIMVEVKFFTQ